MKKIISILTIVALILGIILGVYLPSFSSSISFIGEYYVKILKLFITPVIFTSIATTIYVTSKKKSRLVLKSILIFTIMFIITFLITSLLVTLIDPSNGFVFEEVEWTNQTTTFDLGSMILNLFPKSLSEVLINPKVFAIIVFAYIFGKVGSLIKGSESFFKGLDTVKKWLYKILGYFMYTTPLAVLSLTSNTIAKYGITLLGSGAKYILTAWGCSIICLIIVMMLPVIFIGKIKPLDYIKKVSKVWVMTLTTRSSAATLPYTCKVCNEEFNVKEEITDVVVPLGCTIHMCGGAVSFALLGLFCAKLYGINITAYMYVIMIISSLLINMAAPGIPNGGIVIGASYLEMLGIPLNFIGFYSGIYPLLDMIYTTLNVTGDITANIIINKQIEGK